MPHVCNAHLQWAPATGLDLGELPTAFCRATLCKVSKCSCQAHEASVTESHGINPGLPFVIQARRGKGGCPFLSDKKGGVALLADALLAVPQDIEEAVVAGKRRGSCPFYAARRAAPQADLVLLPYASLLIKVTPISEAKYTSAQRPMTHPEIFQLRARRHTELLRQYPVSLLIEQHALDSGTQMVVAVNYVLSILPILRVLS